MVKSVTDTGELTSQRPLLGEEGGRSGTRFWLLAAGILLLVGPVLAGLTYRSEAAYETERVRAEFEEHVVARSADLQAEMHAYLEALHWLRSHFLASEEVTREEFRSYTRDLLQRYPSIRAVEWAPRVSPSERAARADRPASELDAAPSLDVTERSSHGELVRARRRYVHYPIEYVEPFLRNQAAWRFDLYSEKTRRDAINRAIGSEQATLSAPIVLVQDPLPPAEGPTSKTSKGYLLVLPVFREAELAVGGEGPVRARVAGLVLLVFRGGDVVRDALLEDLSESTASMHFQLLHLGDREEEEYLVAAFGECSPDSAGVQAVGILERCIGIGAQRWCLRACPTTAFLAMHSSRRPFLLALVVFLGWGLLAGAVLALARSGQDALLRRQSNLMRSVLRNLEEGVVVADGDGKVRIANRSAVRMLGSGLRDLGAGASTSGIVGRFLQPDGQTPYPTADFPLHRALQGESVAEEEIRVRRFTGSDVWLSVSGRPLVGAKGAAHGGVTVIRDVTERKSSEHELRRLSSAVEQTADAVFITDREGRLLYANPAFEQTTGYSREEVMGQTPRFLKSGEHDDAWYAGLWETILRGEVFRSNTMNRKKSGEVFPAEQTVTPMKDDQGRVTHFVAVCKDMTESRKIQEQEVEMHLAAQVQEKLYPPAPPAMPGLDIAGAVFPAEATCGDYYDYIELPDETLAIAVGDVCGHGLGPALVMAETRAYLRSLAGMRVDVGEMLQRTNAFLAADIVDHLFVTLLLVAIDPKSRRIVHASAGHTPGFIMDDRGEVKATLSGTGVPLGMFPDSEYHCSESATVDEDDVLVLLTDGVTESRAPDDSYFEAGGVLEVVRAHRHESAEQIVAHIRAAIRAFTGAERPNDDITLVVVKGVGAPATQRA